MAGAWFFRNILQSTNNHAELQWPVTTFRVTKFFERLVPLAFIDSQTLRNLETLDSPKMSLLFNKTPLELDTIETPSSHRPLHILFEGSSVCLELSSGLLIQRVIRVGFEEQVLQSIYN